MATALGEGRYRYRLACAGRNWGELPDGWRFGDVAVDRHDNLYVFARAEHPVTVFDRERTPFAILNGSSALRNVVVVE
jgi:hypothetical protein